MTTDEKLKAALDVYNKLSPEQKVELHAQQRDSWVKGEAELMRTTKSLAATAKTLGEAWLEVERLRNTLKYVRNMVLQLDAETGCCCCGDPVDSHSLASGHAPVDQGDYYKDGIIAEIDRALGATE